MDASSYLVSSGPANTRGAQWPSFAVASLFGKNQNSSSESATHQGRQRTHGITEHEHRGHDSPALGQIIPLRGAKAKGVSLALHSPLYTPQRPLQAAGAGGTAQGGPQMGQKHRVSVRTARFSMNTWRSTMFGEESKSLPSAGTTKGDLHRCPPPEPPAAGGIIQLIAQRFPRLLVYHL